MHKQNLTKEEYFDPLILIYDTFLGSKIMYKYKGERERGSRKDGFSMLISFHCQTGCVLESCEVYKTEFIGVEFIVMKKLKEGMKTRYCLLHIQCSISKIIESENVDYHLYVYVIFTY